MTAIKIDHWSKFGAALRDARLEQQMTQDVLAKKAGVSRAWLARFESGHRRAEMEQVLRVLSALDLWLSIEKTARTPGEQAVLAAFASSRHRP
jgi:transcriptional regulator with XRE-family HTH domain